MNPAPQSAIGGVAIGVLAAEKRFCPIGKKTAHDSALFTS